jgi:membrane protein
VTWAGLKRALAATYHAANDNLTFQMAAGLSYYLVLSIFPSLILFFAVVALLPFAGLNTRFFALICALLPVQAVPMVQSVLLDVLGANHTAWLSLGTIGTIWIASSAFDGMIDALDVAYDVKEARPYWKTRLLAIALAATTGALLLVGLAVLILGPRFGLWVAAQLNIPRFAPLWPVFHWVVASSVALLAVELIYFLAPNVKQRFLASLPGALLAVSCWIAFSFLLGFYFRHFANFSRTYGTLAGFIAFMTWFYWNSFALLLGGELNAQLAKESANGALPQKETPDDENLVEPGA